MFGRTRTRVVTGAVAIAALAGGGAAIAASTFGGQEDSQAIIEAAAEDLGVTPAALTDALEQAYAARIDAAVAAGELTQEQADAIKERIESGSVPLVGGPMGRGFGHGHLHMGLDAAAAYLGLSEADLRDELVGGATLAEVAEEQGKTVEGLKEALAEDARSDLEAAVADGRLTQAQADEMLANLDERLDDLVNRQGFGRHGGPPGAPGADVPAEPSPDGATTTTTTF